jgi:ABC-type transport system substrate-binding protein
VARTLIARVTVFCLLAACTGGPEPPASPAPPDIPRGRTLRLGSPLAPGGEFTNPLRESFALDPGKIFAADQWELLRCCLARTLLSYPGKPTRAGGATLQPDLAASMPEVSADGLTWSFRLKSGLRYGPPLEDVPIRAQDVIRALERHAGTDFGLFYPVIQGFDAFAAGETDSIAGLEAPDDHTLRVHLVAPTGDLGERFGPWRCVWLEAGATGGPPIRQRGLSTPRCP